MPTRSRSVGWTAPCAHPVRWTQIEAWRCAPPERVSRATTCVSMPSHEGERDVLMTSFWKFLLLDVAGPSARDLRSLPRRSIERFALPVGAKIKKSSSSAAATPSTSNNDQVRALRRAAHTATKRRRVGFAPVIAPLVDLSAYRGADLRVRPAQTRADRTPRGFLVAGKDVHQE